MVNKVKLYKLVKGYHRMAYRLQQRKEESLVPYLALVLPHLLYQVQIQELQVCLTNINVNSKCICSILVWNLECKRLPDPYFPLLLTNTYVYVPQVSQLKECSVLVAK